MEKALRYELATKIPELLNQIYPTNAPESASKPYLVYTRINTDITKTLEGYTDNEALSFMFSIMATKYTDMKSLTDKVKTFLISIPNTYIGENKEYYIHDIKINNISELYESGLQVNRGILDFTIYY